MKPITRLLLTVPMLALLTIALLSPSALAQSAANMYSTGSHATAENSAVITNKPSSSAYVIEVSNFDASNSKDVMCFDAATLPSNGAIPIWHLGVGAMPTAVQPAQSSNAFPATRLVNGLVCALSTTAKTLTVDTASPANGFFNAWWN